MTQLQLPIINVNIPNRKIHKLNRSNRSFLSTIHIPSPFSGELSLECCNSRLNISIYWSLGFCCCRSWHFKFSASFPRALWNRLGFRLVCEIWPDNQGSAAGYGKMFPIRRLLPSPWSYSPVIELFSINSILNYDFSLVEARGKRRRKVFFPSISSIASERNFSRLPAHSSQ